MFTTGVKQPGFTRRARTASKPLRTFLNKKGLIRPAGEDESGPSFFFGRSIEEAAELNLDGIPIFVLKALQFIDRHAGAEGIFRISGNVTVIEALRAEVESGYPLELSHNRDPYDVASLIKLYFRELPDSLLTFELFQCFIDFTPDFNVNQPATFPQEICRMRSVLARLPPPHFHTLRRLIATLKLVAAEPENKMDSKNLSIVWAPSILYSKNADPVALMMGVREANVCVQFLIEQAADLGLTYSEMLGMGVTLKLEPDSPPAPIRPAPPPPMHLDSGIVKECLGTLRPTKRSNQANLTDGSSSAAEEKQNDSREVGWILPEKKRKPRPKARMIVHLGDLPMTQSTQQLTALYSWKTADSPSGEDGEENSNDGDHSPRDMMLSSTRKLSTGAANSSGGWKKLRENPYHADAVKGSWRGAIPSASSPEVQEVIDRMAEFCVTDQTGFSESFQSLVMTREARNPQYQFLFDADCVDHKYYIWKVKQLVNQQKRAQGLTDSS